MIHIEEILLNLFTSRTCPLVLGNIPRASEVSGADGQNCLNKWNMTDL